MKIVLLPGLDGTGKLFDSLVSVLPPDLSAVTCVYPKDSELGYIELLEIAKDACPKNEPYILLGESFSGPVAIEIGANRPTMLKGIILVNTFVKCPRPRVVDLLGVIPDQILINPPIATIRYLVRNRESIVDPTNSIKSVLQSLSGKLVRSRLESVKLVDVQHIAARIELSVCVLQSEYDMAIPKKARSLLINCLSESELHVLPGNHFGLQTFPNMVARIISCYCREMNLQLATMPNKKLNSDI